MLPPSLGDPVTTLKRIGHRVYRKVEIKPPFSAGNVRWKEQPKKRNQEENPKGGAEEGEMGGRKTERTYRKGDVRATKRGET